jgi:hypothetical protein
MALRSKWAAAQLLGSKNGVMVDLVNLETGATVARNREATMAEEFNAAEKVKEFISGLSTNPNLPNLKAVVGKLGSLPGAAQVKGIQVQVLKVQSELLKGQLMILEQVIQALETAPEDAPAPAPAPKAKKAAKSTKIAVQ